MKKETKLVQRTFVKDQVYNLLRDWIVQGKLAPNQKLKDKEIAQELGVSRTPVREALLKLEEEGLVHTKPNTSTLVSPLDFENAGNLYSIVWTLEGLALRQAFDVLEEKHIKTMTQVNETMRKVIEAKDYILVIEADNLFHSTYIDLSKNVDLIQMIHLAKQKINRLKLHYFHQMKNCLASYQEHLLIIEALKQKNFDLALKAVEKNWKAVLRLS